MKTTVVSQVKVAGKAAGNGAGAESVAGIRILEATEQYQEPLIVSLYGGPGSGKSRFLGTAAGDIGAIPLEHKSRKSIIAAARELGKRVFLPEIDLIRSGRALMLENIPAACISEDNFKGQSPENAVKRAEMAMTERLMEMPLDGECPSCCQRCYYRWHANRIKSVAYRMAEMDNIRTIAIDPFGQFVDDMLFACYGRNEKIMPLDRKTFNREVIDFINAINHKHLLLTHHSDTIWKDNKPTKHTKPKSSFAKIGHFTSVVCEFKRDDDALAYNKAQEQAEQVDGVGRERKAIYSLSVRDCQANASLIGLDLLFDENINFQNLGQLVYEDSDPDYWI